ncbi:oligomeric, coiled-coil, peripheral membrane protein [Lithohypha guttulata]|nr:oligomeric, coiled-coil, peripheral membrane protein [Lithohypha guttulata]
MSLELYLSHTGQRFPVDVAEIPSPEGLKQWISSNVGVPGARQILMTGTGKNVKQQHLVKHAQIFIYDKSFLAGQEPSDIPEDDNSDRAPSLGDPPSELENETSLSAWQELFKARRTWSLEAVDIVKSLSGRSTQLAETCENIDRSTIVALDNLKNHVSNLQGLFEKTQAWASETKQEHADMLREWRSMTDTLKELPIREDVARLMDGQPKENVRGDTTDTMFTILDLEELESADTTLRRCAGDFTTQINAIAGSMERLTDDSDNATALVQVEWPNLETEGLIQEVETLVKKIDGDYSDVLRATSDTKAISKVSRVAANHTNSLLPGIQEVVQESIQVYTNAIEHKRTLTKVCFRVLRAISQIQSTLAGLQGRIQNLTLDEEGQQSLETLDRVFRLPSAYGSILIEAVRRSEWNDRTLADLKSLKDELSQHKDDELRRRKKWTNNMSTFLNEDTVAGSANANTLSEFSFSTPSNPWPFVGREEIFSYIDDLRALEINDAVAQATQQLRDLDTPSKPRRSRPRPFKNGSIHDNMQSSFVRNGNLDPDSKALQDDKGRLEDKLRASESRIRKLEDLLHRQSQVQTSSSASRPASNVFTPIAPTDFERQPSSPGPDSANRPCQFESSSRRSSVSANYQTHIRRTSNSTTDEKAMVQKIVQLEAQLQTTKIDSDNQMRSLQEAESVKRDLLANFEAQRAEFDDERQRLEDDNHELKIKIEEFEEELDRVMGSREHEKVQGENMLNHLRSELERVRKSSIEEIERLRTAKENREQELGVHKDKTSSAELQVQQLRSERSSLQSRNLELANDVQSIESRLNDILGTLQSVHEHLSPAGSAPDDLKRLASALEVLAEGATIHARGLDDALQLATAQGKASEEKIEQLEVQVKRVQSTKKEVEARLNQKDEQLRGAQHSVDTLRSELNGERRQVEQLQARFAAGETGSDALRARLSEEEKKVVELTEAKDKSDVQVENLQQTLDTLREDVTDLNQAAEALRDRLEGRRRKAKDLSERLFQHNDRMIRMLENFGYSVSREGAGLVIQRASKVNASQLLGDVAVGTPMKRQVSGSIALQHFTDTSDAQTLYWTHDEDGKIEDTKFEAFLNTLSRLDIDSTIELITKRYKDVETLAKKYQKDSRLHREKTNRLQSEAHEKIAYRGFKEGDLALFLPTRNQATKPWAAFNVGAPHYFLKEMDGHRLQTRDWLLARISKVEERVVDLSRSIGNASTKGIAEASDGGSLQSIDDNPFELSDGLRWYLVEAAEEKPGAPSTPGLGKSTVAASVIEVKAHMGRKGSGTAGKDSDRAAPGAVNAAKTLHKSLDSRRSSEASRKSTAPILKTSTSNSSALVPLTSTGTDGEAEGTMSSAAPTSSAAAGSGSVVKPSDVDSKQSRAREDDRIFDVVRQDLMLGP